jgi:3-oxoacyl-[acyl-carrier-protein] synthase II
MTAHPTGSPAVAVTGIGVLTPLGDSVESLEAALRAGKVAVEAAPDLDGAAAARIADFEATRYANVRGLRLYSRPTRLGICASRLALAGAGLETGVAPEDLGVIVASTFAHLETLLEYDRSVVSAGIARTNPALMPLAIPSAPGAAVALSFVAKAFSITLADGGTSGLDALGLGARLVASGRARACLVVGMFPVVPELVLSASKAGMLAPAGDFRVLDRRRCGTAFGEAGVAFVLERLDEARARGATPLAIVAGQASSFEVGPSGLEGAIARACRDALAGASTSPADVGLVASGANGSVEGDRAEARAILSVLGDSAPRTAVIAPAASLGDCQDASGLVQALVAIAALRSGVAPPIARLEQPEVAGLRYLVEETAIDTRTALVTSTSLSGAASALVIASPA